MSTHETTPERDERELRAMTPDEFESEFMARMLATEDAFYAANGDDAVMCFYDYIANGAFARILAEHRRRETVRAVA